MNMKPARSKGQIKSQLAEGHPEIQTSCIYQQIGQPDKCSCNDLSVSGPDLNSNLRGVKRKRCNFAEMKLVEPKAPKQIVEGRKIDMYCWICHKQGQEILCNSCPRVFHENCINRSKCKFSDSGHCFECHSPSLIKDVQVQPIEYQRLRSLLKFAMAEACKVEVSKKKKNLPRNKSHRLENPRFSQYFKTWIPETNDKLCNIMDLDILIDKIHDSFPYLSCAAFFSDVKWIFHNSYIQYGADSVVTENALKLEKSIKQQLLDIEGCPECYYLKHSEEYKNINSFLKVCKNTHEVVWAKVRGFPYWPAKLLRIYNGHCDVRFFANHDKSVIPISLCFKISEQSPNNREIKQAKYKEACKEMSSYLTNYREIVTHFAYSSHCTLLNGDIKGKKPKRNHCRRKAISEADVTKDPELIETSKSNKMSCTSNLILPNSMDITNNENYNINCSEKDQACMDFVANDDVVVPSESSRLIDSPTVVPNQLIVLDSISHELDPSAATNIPMPSTSYEAINSNNIHDKNAALNAVNKGLQNHAVKDSLWQVHSSNRPQLKDILKQGLDYGITTFLGSWLSSLTSDENVETDFIEFKKFVKSIDNLEKNFTCLSDMNKNLQEENEVMANENQNIETEINTLMDREKNAKKIIDVLTQKVSKISCSKECKKSEIAFQKLEEKAQNLTVAVRHRDYLLNQLNDQHKLDLQKIEQLQNVLTSNEKTYSTISGQTLPNDQEFISDMSVDELVSQGNQNLNQEQVQETEMNTFSKNAE